MKLVFYQFICFIFLTVSFSGRTFGQIFNVNADTVVSTSPVSTDSSIFVFRTHSTGTLKAGCPVPGPASFQWSAYDTITHVFKTNTISTDSIVANLPSGGYQVHITATGYDSRFTAWVYIDSLTVTLEKDNQGNLSYTRYTCDHTDFPSGITQSNLICYNTKGQKLQPSVITYLWSSNANVPIYSWDNSNDLWLDTSRLPLEKARFYLQIKDGFGAVSKKDSVNY